MLEAWDVACYLVLKLQHVKLALIGLLFSDRSSRIGMGYVPCLKVPCYARKL